MPDNNSINSLINLIPDSVDNTVKNLTDLPTKAIGQTLSDCWYLIFGKLSKSAEMRRMQYTNDLEKFKKELSSSIETVPDEFKVDANSQIALLALNNAKFCIEQKDLRAMYVKLLTSAVDSRKTVHPSFAQIILSMDHVDAIILNQFKEETIIPICDYNIYASAESSKYEVYASNVILHKPDNINLSDASRSLDSLKRLGLIEIPSMTRIKEDNIYDIFRHIELYNDLISNYPENLIFVHEKLAKLTNLGFSFIDCCL